MKKQMHIRVNSICSRFLILLLATAAPATVLAQDVPPPVDRHIEYSPLYSGEFSEPVVLR
jgi:hypothetical protein